MDQAVVESNPQRAAARLRDIIRDEYRLQQTFDEVSLSPGF